MTRATHLIPLFLAMAIGCTPTSPPAEESNATPVDTPADDVNGDDVIGDESGSTDSTEPPSEQTAAEVDAVERADGDKEQAREIFDEFDANGDGRLQKDEVAAEGQEFFERVDSDEDGEITPAELQAFFVDQVDGSDDPDALASRGAGDYWEHNEPNAAFSDDPNAVLGALNVAPGFEVNLFASEPMIENPIQMAWDTAGRLWVICSPTYPQLDPAQERSDYIAVLEDTDNDGRADRRTIFAEGLLVPTGIEFGDGGVYVANAPDVLFLADTDGDLKADVRRTVLSGFGPEDNHHAISAFVWSPGGGLHFQSGIFLHTQVETPYGVIRADDGVIFEFTPRKMKLDRYVYGSGINPWGHDFD